MILALLTFSFIGCGLIYFAGWRDAARDPRLTTSIIVALLVLPVAVALLPKAEVLPRVAASAAAPASFSYLAIIWAMGSFVVFARLGLDLWKIHRLKAAAEPTEVAGFAVAYRCETVTTPFVVGVFRPALFLPARWEDWPEATRDSVLRHEAAHIARRDPLWRTVAGVACALYWWNPCVWWLARRLIIQSELACDEAVISEGHSASAYAHLLCDLAESGTQPLSAAAIGGGSFLRQRVQRLVAPRKSLGFIQISCLIALSLTTALSVAVLRQKSIAPEPGESYPEWEVETRMNANPFPGDAE